MYRAVYNMRQIVILLCLGVLLSGCMSNSYYPRAYGEDWKFYPYVEGSAKIASEEGSACWKNDPNNRQGLCY